MTEYPTEYVYFLGCITPNRYPGIEAATKKIFKEFGIETKEMMGASCCPAPGVFGSFDMHTWLPIAARNLAIAEEMDLEIYVTCNGCYGSLQEADHLLKGNPKLKEKTNKILGEFGREYKGTTKVNHSIVVLHDFIGLDKLKERITKPMNDVNVAVHYGCHFLKPREVRGHGPSETPYLLEDLVIADPRARRVALGGPKSRSNRPTSSPIRSNGMSRGSPRWRAASAYRMSSGLWGARSPCRCHTVRLENRPRSSSSGRPEAALSPCCPLALDIPTECTSRRSAGAQLARRINTRSRTAREDLLEICPVAGTALGRWRIGEPTMRRQLPVGGFGRGRAVPPGR